MTGVVLKYPGAKYTLADWLIAQMPAHRVYCEPFFGSGAVFFRKPPARLETINDLDGRVVNLFRVMRDQSDELARVVAATPWARAELRDVAENPDAGGEVERARRFLVWCWQQIGRRTNTQGVNGWRWTKDAGSDPVHQWRRVPARIAVAAERLRYAQIECRPALDVIASHQAPEVLIYADPPYLPATLPTVPYRHALTTEEHAALLDALDAHPGPAILSGYRSELYDARLAHWQRVDRPVLAEGGRARTETIWLNQRAARPTLFDLASVEEAALQAMEERA